MCRNQFAHPFDSGNPWCVRFCPPVWNLGSAIIVICDERKNFPITSCTESGRGGYNRVTVKEGGTFIQSFYFISSGQRGSISGQERYLIGWLPWE